jgi:predicted DNA-binding protein (MmcQ/YjbR family)
MVKAKRASSAPKATSARAKTTVATAKKSASKRAAKPKGTAVVETTTTKTAKGPLLDYALSLPEAYEDHPWGESVAKVNKKVFAFFGVGSPAKSLSIKLGDNADIALALPCATPTGYGLGKSGWVSIDLLHKSCPPIEILREWIQESFCNVAPKKLVKALAAT